jgi:hypothetical protein
MDPELAAAFPEDAARIGGLIQTITVAFEGVPRPRITRSVADAIDDCWGWPPEKEEKELNARDPEQVWTDVTEEQIWQPWSYFDWSNDEGWRFYLPAHMCIALRALPHETDSEVYEHCTRPNPCFGLLNQAQLECVQEFVILVREYR